MANTITVHLEADQKAYVAELARRKRVRPGAVVRWALDHHKATHPDARLLDHSPECTCRSGEEPERPQVIVPALAGA